MTGVLIREKETGTHVGVESCWCGARDWSYVAVSQGMLKIVSNHQYLGESHEQIPP